MTEQAKSAPMPSWEVEDHGSPTYLDGIESQFCISAGDHVMAYAFERDAARLIAAAPELLEALRAVCDQADARAAKTEAETGRPVVRSPAALAVYNLARATIAKATGGAS